MAARYMYAKEVSHQGLNKYRVVKAPTRHELERKVSALQAQWDEQWRKIQEREAKQRNLAQERADKQSDRGSGKLCTVHDSSGRATARNAG